MKKLSRLIALSLVAGVSLANATETDKQKRIEMGKTLYNQVCLECHNVGLDGAPRIGQAQDWKVIAQYGKDALLESVIKGKGMMPPRAGSADESAEHYRMMIEYMLSTVGMEPAITTPVKKEAADRARHISNGKTLYGMVCYNCHTTGKIGAPKIGDKAVWDARYAKGFDALVNNVSQTHGGMVRVGASAIQSIEGVREMVAYMLTTAGYGTAPEPVKK